LSACLLIGAQTILAQSPDRSGQDDQRIQEQDAALELYRYRLVQTGTRLRAYPRAAVEQHLEGMTTVDLIIAGNGSLASANLINPSGHPSLDEYAMALLAQAVPLTQIPRALQNSRFALRVSIAFKLPD